MKALGYWWTRLESAWVKYLRTRWNQVYLDSRFNSLMAEGSSVDLTASENGEGELVGLNITSEIVKEDNDYDESWGSFLEDSIHQRAAKVLNLKSVKELFPHGNNTQHEKKSRSKMSYYFFLSKVWNIFRFSSTCIIYRTTTRLFETSNQSWN